MAGRSPEPISLTAAETGRQIAAGADPVEIAEATLARIEADDSAAFISITSVRAMREAEAARSRQKENRLLGPLDGVPVAWKDLFDIAGSVTTCASEILRNAAPSESDAVCAANAAAAGMVSVGKTNLTEFAFSGLGINPHFGTPSNPNDPEIPRVPGGSSSGSAVAVAAGIVPAAIGTDTGGSVRIPAALNGIVGLKTSDGRISLEGIAPLAQSFDTVGPLARTVEDCILLDAVLRGMPPTALAPANPAELTFLVPENYVLERLEPAVAENFETTLKALADAGAHIERHHCAFLEAYGKLFPEHGMLTAHEAMENWRHVLEGPDSERMDPRVRSRMLAGTDLAGRVEEARANRANLTAAFESELGDRFLLHPTTIFVAPEIAPLDADPELYHRVNMRMLRNTMPGNYLHSCGVSLPNGRDDKGLPTAVLISARGGSDDRLHGAALAAESILTGLGRNSQ